MAKAVRQPHRAGGADERTQPHRPIDMVHLAKQTLGDHGIEREVLMMYSDLSAAYCARLKASTTRDEMAVHLHSLKGASAGVGANGIAWLARTAEEELRETGAVSTEQIADIEMAVEDVRAFIARIMEG